MRYLSDFFWRYSWDVGTLATNDSEFHVCLSVCLFAYFLTKIRQRHISGSGWDIFLKFFGDIPEMLVHWFQIILIFCMSISLVVGILPYKYRNISCSGPDVNLIFWEISLGCWYTSYKLFRISCMSASLFDSLLPYQNYTKGYIQFWIRYPSGIFWRHSFDVGTMVPNYSYLFACLSVLSGHLYYSLASRCLKWFKFLSIFLQGQQNISIWCQIIKSILVPFLDHFRSYVHTFYYSHIISPCKILLNGYCGIVLWSFSA